MMDDYPAVAVFCTACSLRHHAITRCSEAGCCWAWQRRGAEDRMQRREEERNETMQGAQRDR
jgi:hypothetical protein